MSETADALDSQNTPTNEETRLPPLEESGNQGKVADGNAVQGDAGRDETVDGAVEQKVDADIVPEEHNDVAVVDGSGKAVQDDENSIKDVFEEVEQGNASAKNDADEVVVQDVHGNETAVATEDVKEGDNAEAPAEVVPVAAEGDDAVVVERSTPQVGGDAEPEEREAADAGAGDGENLPPKEDGIVADAAAPAEQNDAAPEEQKDSARKEQNEGEQEEPKDSARQEQNEGAQEEQKDAAPKEAGENVAKEDGGENEAKDPAEDEVVVKERAAPNDGHKPTPEPSNDDEVLITVVEDAAQRPETGMSVEPDGDGEYYDDEEPEDDEPDVPPIVVAKYPDEELMAALDRYLKKKELPDVEMRPCVVDFAKKQSLYQLMNEDYIKAAAIDEAISALMLSLHSDEKNYDCEQQTQNLDKKLEDAIEQQKFLQKDFEEKIRRFKEVENEKLSEVQKQHEQARKAFEEHWADPDTMVSFSKPSVQLLQLRRMQKSLAISHHFAQARQLKLAGDQMQKEETAQANKKAVGSMKIAYAQLLEKQQKEIDCFMDNGYRKLVTLEGERDRRLKANENLRNQLEARLKGPKHARRPTVTVPQVTSRGEPRQPVTGVVTFRTRGQFASYKKATEKSRLEVRIGDVQKITKPMTPTPRKGQKPSARFT